MFFLLLFLNFILYKIIEYFKLSKYDYLVPKYFFLII